MGEENSVATQRSDRVPWTSHEDSRDTTEATRVLGCRGGSGAGVDVGVGADCAMSVRTIVVVWVLLLTFV